MISSKTVRNVAFFLIFLCKILFKQCLLFIGHYYSRLQPLLADVNSLGSTYTQKTWSQFCHSVHVLRLSHCPICLITEQQRKPHGMYIHNPTKKGFVFTTPLRGVLVALFLTDSLNLRDSNTLKPKRPENAFNMYVPMTFGNEVNRTLQIYNIFL